MTPEVNLSSSMNRIISVTVYLVMRRCGVVGVESVGVGESSDSEARNSLHHSLAYFFADRLEVIDWGIKQLFCFHSPCASLYFE